MRIAMLTNNYKPIVGGVPISVERLSVGLRKRGHRVVIFAPQMEGQQQEEDVVRYRSIRIPTGHGMVVPEPMDKTIARHFSASVVNGFSQFIHLILRLEEVTSQPTGEFIQTNHGSYCHPESK